MAESPRNRSAQAPAGQAEESIPPPDKVPGSPDNPLELGGTGWRHTLKRAGKEFVADRCSMTAGSLAYYWFLALFPALIALLGLARLIHLNSSMVQHLVRGDANLWPKLVVQAVAIRHDSIQTVVAAAQLDDYQGSLIGRNGRRSRWWSLCQADWNRQWLGRRSGRRRHGWCWGSGRAGRGISRAIPACVRRPSAVLGTFSFRAHRASPPHRAEYAPCNHAL